MRFACFVVLLWLAIPSPGVAQNNPIPLVNTPLVPANSVPGGAGFTLTVNGTGFVPSSVVNWNGSSRPTTFVSASQVTAAISSADLISAGTASVTVSNPTPGGGLSNTAFFSITQSATSVNFVLASFSTGSQPKAAITADFNGDGLLDIATANSSVGTVSILLGKGDGTFSSNTDFPTGGQPSSIATADFNGDGKLDLAVEGGGILAILLGNGDGTFGSAITSTLYGYLGMVTADFNGDGKLDLAIDLSCLGGNCGVTFPAGIAVLIGNGDGTFQPEIDLITDPNGTSIPSSVVTGDFNGDGHLDLAAVSQGDCLHCGGTTYVLLGNGDGTFLPATVYNSATNSNGATLVSADLNGDGHLDLAIGENKTGTTLVSNVQILLGSGDGTFQPGASYVVSQDAAYVIGVGDLNGDGKLDLAVAQSGVLLGNGDGTFGSVISVATGSLSSLVLGDVNADGRLDLIGADYYTNSVTVLSQVVGSAVTLSPSSLDFGNQTVGLPSQSEVITLTNSGSLTLNISSIGVIGSNAADFSQTNSCGTSLGVGASCSIFVTFTPTTTGTRSASVNIVDDAPNSPQVVPLAGIGVAPAVTLSPAALTFPTQVVFTTSKAQVVTLSNTGSGVLVLSGISASSQFVQSNTCGTTVAPGASCTISVTFTPQVKGPISGSVSINDNAPGSPQIISLKGTGTYIQIMPLSVNFGNQPVRTKSLPKRVTVTNKGNTTVTISGISLGGTNSTDFSETTTCQSSLSAGASCFVSVTFTPRAKGTRSGILSVTDNGGGSPQVVTLTGTGT